MNIDNINIPIEVIGVFALIFIVLSFFETDKKMFILIAIGSFFYGIHFLGLGLLTAAYINFFDIAKNLTVIRYKKNTTLFLLFVLAYTIIGFITGKGNILPYLFALASIVSLYAAFYLKGLSLRMVYFVSITIQLIYTIIGNSLTGSITNILFLLSVTSSAYLLYKRRGFWGKMRYAKFLLLKKTRKLLGYRYGRVKFLG